MFSRCVRSLFVIAAACIAATGTASAHSHLALDAGTLIPLNIISRDIGGNFQKDFGASLDLGLPKHPLTQPAAYIVDLRADVEQGNRAQGHFTAYGAGFEARVPSTFYAGFGLSVYEMNAVLNGPNMQRFTQFGVVPSVFIGDKLYDGAKGDSLAIQATYRKFQTVAGILDLSSFEVGLRGHL